MTPYGKDNGMAIYISAAADKFYTSHAYSYIKWSEAYNIVLTISALRWA